jgi:guanosine-3',5'-bis(diphosphate) 3'-pyrophosphohydrolase
MSADGSMAGRLLAAARFSAERHRDQRRKGVRETPYINHPIEVAELLVRIGGVDDIDVLVAAILHDTVEDTETKPEEIEREFGASVVALVLEVTDPPLTRLERKRLEVEHAPHLSPRAKLIKLADKICNVADTASNPPASWSRQRRHEYLDFAEQIALGCRGVSAALDAEFVDVLTAARVHIG